MNVSQYSFILRLPSYWRIVGVLLGSGVSEQTLTGKRLLLLRFTMLRLFSESVDEVEKREKRMTVCHPGACVPHHIPDLFSHIRLIAMYPAICTCCFIFPERTSFKTPACIIRKFLALSAKFIVSPVMTAAKDIYHRLNGLLLSRYPAILFIHDGRPPTSIPVRWIPFLEPSDTCFYHTVCDNSLH